jgi:HD-like signal output (HDOD) protein
MTTDYPEGAFAAGLLQNVGMLLIATGLPTEYVRIRDEYVGGDESLANVERALIGLDHAELSEEVLRQWNLPKQIQQAVGAHHRADPQTLGSVVEASDVLAEQHGIVVQAWCRPAPGKPEETLERLGLGGKADRILQGFHAEFETLRAFFG